MVMFVDDDDTSVLNRLGEEKSGDRVTSTTKV